MAARIEDYALIGDCGTAALVGRDGSIDWLCWPRFDSGACFAALLGTVDHGRWLIAPQDGAAHVTRRYRDRTLIVETEIETATGAAIVIDFMPERSAASHVVRLVVGRRGHVAMRTELVLRFDYGSIVPWVNRLDATTLRAVAGPDMAILRTPVPLRGEDLRTVGEFEVRAGRTIPFVLTYAPSHLPAPAPLDPAAALAATGRFWRGWCSRFRDGGEWSEAVLRSLITLKALTYRPSGGIVAAPTTSLPERLGGKRNWDYRFCWLRDATFTLQALMNAGYYDEARAWRAWLLRAVAGTPAQVQIMYGLHGERRLDEWTVPWLPGYQGAAPVRIGNAAADQLQLDIFGEMMNALYQGRSGAMSADEAGWMLQLELLRHLEAVWSEPDEGIWEMRGGRRQFVHSKVMAWVAFDRAVRSVEHLGLEGPVQHWRALRQKIHAEVCAKGFDPGVGAFVQHYGSSDLDAAALLIPLVGFLPPQDPRVRSTVEAIERRLLREGLVARYDTASGKDGLPAGEGAFLACSFWLVDNLALLGRRDDARRLFERLLALRNDVGLLAEEYDVASGRQVGNFPQAFSHVALVNAARYLRDAPAPAGRRRASEAAA
jgi:GH15 family glucan-1,4-alpha-glucosidase